MSFKIDVIKNLAKFTGNTCVGVLFFNYYWSLFFIKKRFQQRYISVNIAKFLRTVFFKRTPPVAASRNCKQLLPKIVAELDITKNR